MVVNPENFGAAIQSYVSQHGGSEGGWSVAMDPDTGEVGIERWDLLVPEPTEGELDAALLAAKQQQKLDEIHGQAFDELSYLFTPGHGRDELEYVISKHIETIFNALALPLTDERMIKTIEVGDKAMAIRAQVEAILPTDPDPLGALENITWEP